MKRLRTLQQVEALRDAGMTKSEAVLAIADVGYASAASIWNWFSLVDGVHVVDRLAYRGPIYRGGGKPAEIDAEIYAVIAADYLRPECLSWAKSSVAGQSWHAHGKSSCPTRARYGAS